LQTSQSLLIFSFVVSVISFISCYPFPGFELIQSLFTSHNLYFLFILSLFQHLFPSSVIFCYTLFTLYSNHNESFSLPFFLLFYLFHSSLKYWVFWPNLPILTLSDCLHNKTSMIYFVLFVALSLLSHRRLVNRPLPRSLVPCHQPHPPKTVTHRLPSLKYLHLTTPFLTRRP
jgi:hypothetical protein